MRMTNDTKGGDEREKERHKILTGTCIWVSEKKIIISKKEYIFRKNAY